MWWKVDDLRHGAAPHNLMIDHPNGYASFYGHLLERPDLRVGQAVRQVDMIAKVGDPDVTCTSRPHLHLEIRNVERFNISKPTYPIERNGDPEFSGSFGPWLPYPIPAPVLS